MDKSNHSQSPPLSPASMDRRPTRSATNDTNYAPNSPHSDADTLEREPSPTPAPAGKPGRKKNPNSQAARRDQNRIAQREFRLRKQQRIRDLETKVELLSGNKDETFNYMRNILRDLMTENHTLRGLVKGLSECIGDGLPGFLPRFGLNHAEFEDFVNKKETDTAIEAFSALKRKMQAHGNTNGQKRAADEPADTGGSKKRAKVSSYSGPSTRSSLSSSGSPVSPNILSNGPVYAQQQQQQQQDVMTFSALFDLPYNASSNSVLLPPLGASTELQFPSTSQRDMFSLPSMAIRPRSQVNGLGAPLESSSLGLTNAPLSMPSASSSQSLGSGGAANGPDEPRKQEAFKLIHYHLDNYRRNPSYHLPPSLRPSLIQRTIPHDTVIDAIPCPELRDRMILLKGRYELAECVFSFGGSCIIHGDDALAHTNWELGESWLRQYWFLVDNSLLNITNHWRHERGDHEFTLEELGASENIPTFGALDA